MKFPTLQLAHPGKRSLAFVIDVVIVYLGAVFTVGGLVLIHDAIPPDIRSSLPGSGNDAVAIIIGVMLLVLWIWLYHAGLESSKKRATLGKRIFGIKVVDEMGKRICFAQATVRILFKIVSAIPCFAGFFFYAFTPKKQALHDLVSKTVVVHAGTVPLDGCEVHYVIRCECGSDILIDVDQAGTKIRCLCLRDVAMPSPEELESVDSAEGERVTLRNGRLSAYRVQNHCGE